PIWITEANAPVDDPSAPGDALVGPDAVSLEQQAAFVLQIYALARAEGVRSLAIYRASDVDEDRHYWGLLRNDISARPALLAYRTAAQWLSHSELVGLSHPTSATTRVELRRGRDEIDVLWSSGNQPTTLRLPAAASAAGRLVDVAGQSKPIRGSGGAFAVPLP